MAHTLRRSTVGEASKRGLFHSGETMAGAEMNLWVSPDGAAFAANKLFIFDWEALAHPRGQTKKEVHLLPGVVDTLSLLSQWQHAAHGGSGPGMCVLRDVPHRMEAAEAEEARDTLNKAMDAALDYHLPLKEGANRRSRVKFDRIEFASSRFERRPSTAKIEVSIGREKREERETYACMSIVACIMDGISLYYSCTHWM